MSRIIAIDYGTKRVGIAVTDSLQIIATGLTTVHSKDVINFLKNYIDQEEVECIVIGEPKKMNNQVSESSKYVELFIKSLKKNIPGIQIERIDERFTSKMAFQTMIDSGLNKKARRNKELVDEISATMILQTFMQLKKNRSIGKL
jgi:putative Holliday junction resolvase